MKAGKQAMGAFKVRMHEKADKLFNEEGERVLTEGGLPDFKTCEEIAELEGSDPHHVYAELLDRLI